MAMLLQGLQTGCVTKVVPVDKLSIVLTFILAAIFLHEQLTVRSLLGCLLILAGTVLVAI